MMNVTTRWQRSSFCADGNCVEVLRSGDLVMIRDSKRAEARPITLTSEDFSGFVAWLEKTESAQ